jgi:tetratricopeptide (TPR) repeat protein
MGFIGRDPHHITRLYFLPPAVGQDPATTSRADDQDRAASAFGARHPVALCLRIESSIRYMETPHQWMGFRSRSDRSGQDDVMLAGESFATMTSRADWKIIHLFQGFVHSEILVTPTDISTLRGPKPIMASVSVHQKVVSFPTYLPAAPDKNPMFLEKRVYQGSSGKVYPLPFYDRIAEEPVAHDWEAIFIENDYLEVMILPALGGRIHRMVDKTNGYDVIYHQPVIKPALVGLAGPWISGGIEFNWPQHHRPSTFMPADFSIEHHEDGSVTVWLSEHDPMARMKGMHGVCLHPDRSVLELKARVYNRTEDVQTFLWWANVATEVHEHYQSFFPQDASYVADHAKRAMSTFPLCSDHYYGIDYASRGKDGVPEHEAPAKYKPTGEYPANDLSWYANIPVPTSYMCMGSREDFFGGYDFRAKAGIVHVANHHISPGKKQWTWGNHEFGYAWDRNLTDADGKGEFRPYIELMAGVYTDNQPDFSYLQPGETKSWSQYWYPIRDIGPVCAANEYLALSVARDEDTLRIGICSTGTIVGARVKIFSGRKLLRTLTANVSPAKPVIKTLKIAADDLLIVIGNDDGTEWLRHSTVKTEPLTEDEIQQLAATEPPLPADIPGNDELYITGLHLEQYRHATRSPALYWQEALRRDPGDSRCHLAMGRLHLRRGEFGIAIDHLRKSIQRQTLRNPNPYDGEALYQLGRALRFQGFDDEAYDAFYKATWNQAWAGAAYHRLAEIDCTRGDYARARDHLLRALRFDSDNLKARDLLVLAKRRMGLDVRDDLAATLALDPLDQTALWLANGACSSDSQTRLDLALDFTQAGFHEEALAVLEGVQAEPLSGSAPLIHYYRGWILERCGKSGAAEFKAGSKATADYCFPARLIEQSILQAAILENPEDANAHAALGHWLYDRRRHTEAITHWQAAVQANPHDAIVWRCLGIASFNVLKKPAKARAAYQKAIAAAPDDARLIYENDQLSKRLGHAPLKRLKQLLKTPHLLNTRDDLALELCTLYNQTGQPEKALALLTSRNFQPWEGGEGGPLGQYVRAHLLLGQATTGEAAVQHFQAALRAPANLAEAKHLLANQSDIHLLLGDALQANRQRSEARAQWLLAAHAKGDFQNMSVRSFSEMTYYSAIALDRLGRKKAAKNLLKDLLAYARKLAKVEAKIDYFATSLPTMLLFDDDLQKSQTLTARFLEAQARFGLGQHKKARSILTDILAVNPNHAAASDFIQSF